MNLDEAIERICNLRLDEIKEMERAADKVLLKLRMAREERWRSARTADNHIKRAVRTMLKPHAVDWTYPERPQLSDNHVSLETAPHLDGVVSPDTSKPGRFGMPLRIKIHFSLTARTAEELRREVAELKAAADSITAGGY